MIQAIAHPTDFSPAGALAFDHALALALHHRARLDLLHVGGSAKDDDWGKFPRVRERLEAWGRIPPATPASDVAALTGVAVRKIELHEADPAEALGSYLADHLPSLIVMASHARIGLARLLAGSVSSSLLQQVQVPMLLLGPGAGGFVDQTTGALGLTRALVPVDHQPDAAPAFETLAALIEGSAVELDCLHVGKIAPALRDSGGQPIAVRVQDGSPVETILTEAHGAQVIAMASEGRRGLGDILLGSTTERVLAGASVPVLALPVG